MDMAERLFSSDDAPSSGTDAARSLVTSIMYRDRGPVLGSGYTVEQTPSACRPPMLIVSRLRAAFSLSAFRHYSTYFTDQGGLYIWVSMRWPSTSGRTSYTPIWTMTAHSQQRSAMQIFRINQRRPSDAEASDIVDAVRDCCSKTVAVRGSYPPRDFLPAFWDTAASPVRRLTGFRTTRTSCSTVYADLAEMCSALVSPSIGESALQVSLHTLHGAALEKIVHVAANVKTSRTSSASWRTTQPAQERSAGVGAVVGEPVFFLARPLGIALIVDAATRRAGQAICISPLAQLGGCERLSLRRTGAMTPPLPLFRPPRRQRESTSRKGLDTFGREETHGRAEEFGHADANDRLDTCGGVGVDRADGFGHAKGNEPERKHLSGVAQLCLLCKKWVASKRCLWLTQLPLALKPSSEAVHWQVVVSRQVRNRPALSMNVVKCGMGHSPPLHLRFAVCTVTVSVSRGFVSATLIQCAHLSLIGRSIPTPPRRQNDLQHSRDAVIIETLKPSKFAQCTLFDYAEVKIGEARHREEQKRFLEHIRAVQEAPPRGFLVMRPFPGLRSEQIEQISPFADGHNTSGDIDPSTHGINGSLGINPTCSRIADEH
ncbi:hypothetical protein BV25DRAFT_1840967 [Artomyces pyxidatus]|uniref:Uncharacterized protein n=1 Tax=Artomyces pyxidatus TaxID=48021 RepID=A0ACB8SQA8_9AGAM|nr:hypothetical protein BV25DRAFT_1840967 [Artomyces pyxidatus]